MILKKENNDKIWKYDAVWVELKEKQNQVIYHFAAVAIATIGNLILIGVTS